jgi:ATP-dependent Clp protease ATP-binding subunit ClpB
VLFRSQVRHLSARLADRKIDVEVTDRAKALLGELGYDSSFGARPLKRLIQQKIDNGLAGEILEGRVADGTHVKVDAAGKSFTFEAAPRDQ